MLSFPMTSLPSSRVCSVLGRSLLGVTSGSTLLHDSKAVRYAVNSTLDIACADNRCDVAGITGSLTLIKQPRTQRCPLRIPSSTYDKELLVSEGGPPTLVTGYAQEAKNLKQQPKVPPMHRMELHRGIRERHRAAWSELSSQHNPLSVLVVT